MTRDAAIARSIGTFTSGAFKATLARRIAIPTESQNPQRAADLARYLVDEMIPEDGVGCERRLQLRLSAGAIDGGPALAARDRRDQ